MLHTLYLYLGLALFILMASMLPLALAQSSSFEVPTPSASSVKVDLHQVVEPVNRRVMGTCLLFPPFGKQMFDAWDGVLDGVSIRVWSKNNFQKGPNIDLEQYWSQNMTFARHLKPYEIFAFDPRLHIKRKAHYVSETDNNLDPIHQPSNIAKFIHWLNKTPHPDFPNGYGVTAWETWNEPQFPGTGAWPAEDYARYSLDVAHAIHKVDPSVQVGAALHEADMTWNRDLLSKFAARDPKAISFLVTHPYDFYWNRYAKDKVDSYYARVAGAVPVGELRLSPKMKLVNELGHGRWRLVCSEWSTHPQGYGPPYHVSRDMAVAIHIFAMFDTFWKLNIDSAMYFEMVQRAYNPGKYHFSLHGRDAEGKLVAGPTAEVFKFMGKYFRGNRLAISHESSTYPYELSTNRKGDLATLQVPMTVAQGTYDPKAKQLVLVLANRHRDQSVPMRIHLSHFRPALRQIQRVTITVAEPDDPTPLVSRDEQVLLPPGTELDFTIQLPPHSVVGLIMPGAMTLTEDQIFSQDMRFLRSWRVGEIMDPTDKTADHGLGVKLSSEAHSREYALESEPSGYVNVASLLEVSGRLSKLTEGYQSLVSTWLFSPTDQNLKVSLGLDYWGVLSVNGKVALDVTRRKGGPPQPDSHRGAMAVVAGWNEVQLRLASGSKGMGFWLGIPNDDGLMINATAKPPAWPRQWGVMADQGAEVNAWDKLRDTPRSTQKGMTLSAAPNVYRRAYLKWNVAIPKDITPNQVKAKVIITHLGHRGAGKIWLRPVLEDWQEDTVTYENQPSLDSKIDSAMELDSSPRWVFEGEQLDALVRRWLANPSENFGLVVETSNRQFVVMASDDDAAQAPRLELELIR